MPKKVTVSLGTVVEETPKRRRGRPKKAVEPKEVVIADELMEQEKQDNVPQNLDLSEEPKRYRGRPKKRGITANDESGMLPLTIGMILQQARRQKRIKLSSVAKKLCIKEVYLEALEKGHYYAFPALVYGAGFLRAYASFLGLNADEMAERFRQETTNIQAEAIDVPRVSDPVAMPKPKTIVKSILVLVVLYLIWNVIKIMTHHPIPEPLLPTVEGNTPVVEQVVQGAPVTADELEVVPLKQDNGSNPKKQQVTTDKKSEKNEVMPLAPVVKRVGTSYGLKTPARVSFLATDTVKVEIRDTEADSILFQKTLEPGDRYNPVDGVEGLVLRTTNAGGLDIYVDGKKVKTLGKKGQIKTGVSLNATDLLKD